jgi:cyclic pyranopterin monophosphate synthase
MAQSEGRAPSEGVLTHLDGQGHAHMVDVTAKPLTRRLAVARCAVVTTVDAVAALGDAGNGMDSVEAARVAGIHGAKQTSSLVPLCHSIRVDHVSVDVEALTACAVAALSLVGSLLALDPEVSVEELTLWHKSGGRSGDWQRSESGGLQAQETASPLPSEMAGLDPHQQGET